MQYGLRVLREDHPDDIHDAVTHSRSVLNYGLHSAVRLQARDFSAAYINQAGHNPTLDPNANSLSTGSIHERRDVFLYQGDLYAKYYVGNLEVAAEGAVDAGSFKDGAYSAQNATDVTNVLRIGAAVEAKYHMRGDYRGARLSLKAGGASGDSHAGFGALDLADTQRNSTDRRLRNFNFSPDYHIDLLLFRRMLGTVTDAWYLRPELAYRFDEKVQGRVAAIYSQAMMGESTPSAANSATPSKPLGVEFDGELSYDRDSHLERGQVLAALAGGILFPLGGFNNPTLSAGQQGGSFAWTLQARMYMTF
jgi:uncharacterized protein (TIGR04551 family)